MDQEKLYICASETYFFEWTNCMYRRTHADLGVTCARIYFHIPHCQLYSYHMYCTYNLSNSTSVLLHFTVVFIFNCVLVDIYYGNRFTISQFKSFTHMNIWNLMESYQIWLANFIYYLWITPIFSPLYKKRNHDYFYRFTW